MADKHVVVQGALCRCNFGNAPAKIQVSANAEYMNDVSGNSKPAAGSNEIGNPFMPGTFGMCMLTHKPCTPNIIQWDNVLPGVTLSNGGKILTEKSTAVCAAAGAPCVCIIHHGQTAYVAEDSIAENESAIIPALNPLVASRLKCREVPAIRTITLCIEKRNPAAIFTSEKKEEVSVRIMEPLLFEVESYYNHVIPDESAVQWKVLNLHNDGNDVVLIESSGSRLTFSFDASGHYRVQAFGKEQTDSDAFIDLYANNNTLKEEFIISETPYKSGYLQSGTPVCAEAVYKITPPTEAERALVSMQVTDNSKNIIAISDNDKIWFTPTNASATYVVSAIMRTGIHPQQISKEIHTQNNGAISVSNGASTHVVRPRTNMNFHVSQMLHTKLPPVPAAAIQWLLNGRPVGIGPQITINGDVHLILPGKYTVEVRVNIMEGERNNIQQAYWHFEVKNNEVLKILVPGDSTNWIVGRYYTVFAQTLMDYEETLDGPVFWNPYGAYTNKLSTALASQEGSFMISARLGNSRKTLNISAIKATLTRWCFTDEQLIYRPSAGWQEIVRIVISSHEAANEKIPLHLLQINPANCIHHVKDLGEVAFNTDGLLQIDVSINSLKPLLTNTSFEWDTFRLLFAIPLSANCIRLADMKTITCDGTAYWVPQKQSNKRMQEKGGYLELNNKRRVVSVHFHDQRKYPAYKVYKYGQKFSMLVQTANLAGEELSFQIWENRYQGKDKHWFSGRLHINEYGTANATIDSNQLKAGNTLEDSFLRCFYAVIKSFPGNYFYPHEIADKNILNPDNISYYQHIKLSNWFDNFINRHSRANAPVVLGEQLEINELDSRCPACEEMITIEQLAKIFPHATTSSLQIAAATYNRFMEQTGMNTCWNKAHFFAQVAIESGGCLNVKEGESFNWYWEDLGKNFPPFRTAAGKIKAKAWGRAIRKPARPGVTKENQRHIADYVYGPDSVKGKSLGNIQPGDGWKLRGRGLIQLTGREAYTYANKFTRKEKADILLQPDLVATDIKIAVLSSMAFWKWKGLQLAANGNTEVTAKISKVVGLDAISNGKSSHAEKKHFFDTNSSVLFQVNNCRHRKISDGALNRYIVKIDAFSYTLVEQNVTSNQYKYDLYNAGTLIKTFLLQKNRYGLLPFPETGPNWGRYGTRDGGDDNYIAPDVAAPLFGFFYSLPQNGYTDTLYYNDISAGDKRNIGHKGHINGNDIDIRYPGSSNRKGSVLWTEAMETYGSEKEFLKVLEKLLNIATKWEFRNNFAYNKRINNTLGSSTIAHQDHFHLGLRKKIKK